MNCLNDLDTTTTKANESECSSGTPVTADHVQEPLNSKNGDLMNNPSHRQQPAVEVEIVIPESHLIPPKKLGLLKDDERIRSLLESENLCQWIKKVKETPHTSLLSQAMKDAEFRAFSTAVLDLLGPKGHYNEPEETD